MVLARIAVGVLLVAHGFVHLLFLVDDVPEFSTDRSWVVPDAARRPFALGLMAATVVAFAVLALAVWGTPGLSTQWPAITVVACLLSAALLVSYWNRNLVFGITIDVALLVVALTRPEWADRVVG